MTTVAIFVDTQNAYCTVHETYGNHFDYRRFWTRVMANREVLTTRCYATDKGDAKQRGFQNTPRMIDFEVKLKPYIQRAGNSDKGDWSVGATLDAFDALRRSVSVLVSGDSDLDLAVPPRRWRDRRIVGQRALSSYAR